MAVEKFINGKRDDAKHDGAYSNHKRLLNALDEMGLGDQLQYSMQVYSQRDKLPSELVQWHEDLLRFWGLIGQSIPPDDEIS